MINVHKLHELGLTARTFDHAEIDHVDLIVDDEFHKEGYTDYRKRAIERLRQLGKKGYGFHSNENLLYDTVERVMKVMCLYCERTMVINGGSGNSTIYAVEFKCVPCGATAHVALPSDGIYFTPKESGSQTSRIEEKQHVKK